MKISKSLFYKQINKELRNHQNDLSHGWGRDVVQKSVKTTGIFICSIYIPLSSGKSIFNLFFLSFGFRLFFSISTNLPSSTYVGELSHAIWHNSCGMFERYVRVHIENSIHFVFKFILFSTLSSKWRIPASMKSRNYSPKNLSQLLAIFCFTDLINKKNLLLLLGELHLHLKFIPSISKLLFILITSPCHE